MFNSLKSLLFVYFVSAPISGHVLLVFATTTSYNQEVFLSQRTYPNPKESKLMRDRS